MSNLTKIELLRRFFPEIAERSGAGDKEAAIRINTLSCEAILADMLRLYDAGHKNHGAGVLCIRLHGGDKESSYLPVSDLELDRAMAAREFNTGLETFLAEAISTIEDTNPDKAGLVLLVDNTNAQVFQIPREYPAQSIQALLEEFSG